jgi:transposase
VLSQLCRKCQGNYAAYLINNHLFLSRREAHIGVIWYVLNLTFVLLQGILRERCVLVLEITMSDEKLAILRRSHTLHPRADQVRDPLFTSGSPFFDPRDLVQVKYELLRRVRVDGYSVAFACSLFALSRPTFYAALAAWEENGAAGLLPEPTGPRRAHKLTEEVLKEIRPLSEKLSSAELAEWLQQHRQLSVHPRSIERALARSAKKGGPS